MFNKILIIIRHATRSKLNSELSPLGRRQAEEIRKFTTKKGLTELKPLLLLSSPKIRCIQTLRPLADDLGVKVTVTEILDEQSRPESDGNFIRRIYRFYRWWRIQEVACCIICTHGDWIPHFFQVVFKQNVELPTGSLAILSLAKNQNKMSIDRIIHSDEMVF